MHYRSLGWVGHLGNTTILQISLCAGPLESWAFQTILFGAKFAEIRQKFGIYSRTGSANFVSFHPAAIFGPGLGLQKGQGGGG